MKKDFNKHFSNFRKKAQALPLNTIVIAILVVVVLVVIVVVFTNSTGSSTEAFEQNGANSCDISNGIISTLYKDAKVIYEDDGSCSEVLGSEWTNFPRVSLGKKDDMQQICCVKK